MRFRFFGMAAGFSVLLPLAALAADPATTTSPTTETAAPTQSTTTAQSEPVLCHYYYWQGMVIKRPVCQTEREWQRERRDQQKWFRDFQIQALIQHN